MISTWRWRGRVSVWARSAVACALAVGLASCSTAATVGSESVPHAARAVELVGERDGVRLTVHLDRDVVAPGGLVRADVRVENVSGRPVRYVRAPCSSAAGIDVRTSLALAAGRRWPGTLGAFKDAAVIDVHLPWPVFTTVLPSDAVFACPAIAIPAGDRTLPAGGSLSARLWWRSDVAPGAPARPGPVVVRARFDAFTRPVDVTGGIRIGGRDPRTPSPGEAVDAALALPAFAHVVKASPPQAWGASVGWADRAWTVVACCVNGSTRAALVRVDARTGAVLSVVNLPRCVSAGLAPGPPGAAG